MARSLTPLPTPSDSRIRRSLVALMAAVVLLGTVGSFAPPAQAAATCDRVAAAYGSDSAPGTEAAPFATPQRLASSLGAGQTGCLRAGKYIQNVKVAKGGTSGAPLTIRSYPDERATVSGRLVVADTANFVRIEGLNLDGSRAPACPTGSTCKILPSPTVNGDDVTFRYNDVTNHNTGICFVLGVPGYGRAERTLLEENRIHGCGRSPSGNYDHGVYVEYAADARIERNTIFDNVDRGVQLYPDAQRTVIRDNVIDGNGEGIIFSGDGGTTSNDSVVEGNAITNSRLRYNVESWYPSGHSVGTGNMVTRNCIRGGARDRGNGGIQEVQTGFTAIDNTVADPMYVDRGAGDFRIGDNSSCRSRVARASVSRTPFVGRTAEVEAPSPPSGPDPTPPPIEPNPEIPVVPPGDPASPPDGEEGNAPEDGETPAPGGDSGDGDADCDEDDAGHTAGSDGGADVDGDDETGGDDTASTGDAPAESEQSAADEESNEENDGDSGPSPQEEDVQASGGEGPGDSDNRCRGDEGDGDGDEGTDESEDGSDGEDNSSDGDEDDRGESSGSSASGGGSGGGGSGGGGGAPAAGPDTSHLSTAVAGGEPGAASLHAPSSPGGARGIRLTVSQRTVATRSRSPITLRLRGRVLDAGVARSMHRSKERVKVQVTDARGAITTRFARLSASGGFALRLKVSATPGREGLALQALARSGLRSPVVHVAARG